MSTALADPFLIRFEYGGEQYSAKITYAKAEGSCENIFDVELLQPEQGNFNLREKPDDLGVVNEPRVWIDQQGFAAEVFQLIGEKITEHMKESLGVIFIDTPSVDKS